MMGTMDSVSGWGPSTAVGIAGVASPAPGAGVAVSSGAGDPAGEERGVLSATSARWVRRSRFRGLMGVAGTAGTAGAGVAVEADSITAEGTLSLEYLYTCN